ncbi:MAG: MinD/ParA family protein, partial [Microbacterium sp.]|nr:MinD/ParA family protein [Microbacterium sp.]
GYADKARDAVVVLNQSTPGTPLVRLNELQAHFSTRVGHVVRIPYDAQIAGGGAIVWTSLAPETRLAARELAAELVEGLRSRVPVR